MHAVANAMTQSQTSQARRPRTTEPLLRLFIDFTARVRSESNYKMHVIPDDATNWNLQA